jgi:putative ATP-binding cassette transporter
VLWSISPKLVVFLISYAVLGTAGTTAVFGAPLTRLKQRLLRLEADLRFGLVRLRCEGARRGGGAYMRALLLSTGQLHTHALVTHRENAEAIAFYGGDVREAADLSARLTSVLDVLLRRIAWLGGYELWLVVYR